MLVVEGDALALFYFTSEDPFFQTCNQLEALVGPASRKGPFGRGDSDAMSKTL